MYYGTTIITSWIVFLVVWVVSAFFAKRDVSNHGVFWLSRVILAVALFIIIRSGYINTFFGYGLYYPNAILGWIAALFTVCGIAFAIWARFYLGRNWSSHPTHKQEHELVTTGPYQYVRHPIYTGILFALLGSAITGSWYAIIILVILLVVYIRRIRVEEKIMLTLFPIEYPNYQAHTQRLIPFVW